LLMLLSIAVVVGAIFIMSTYFNRANTRETYSLGYSCVVFGWMTIYSIRAESNISLFGLSIPPLLFPFASLIFTQFLIPNASFVGHLSGIVIGFFIAFHLFDWVSHYLFFCLLFWVVSIFVWSLKSTTTVALPCIDLSSSELDNPRARMVNGSIIYESNEPV